MGKFLHFAEQRGTLCVWFEVDLEKEWTTRRVLVVYPTGGCPVEGAEHLASLLVMGGDLVWHLYEIPEPKP